MPILLLSQLLFDGIGGVQLELRRRFVLLRVGSRYWDGLCVLLLAQAYEEGEGTPVNLKLATDLYRMLWQGRVELGRNALEGRMDCGIYVADVLVEMMEQAGQVLQAEKREVLQILEIVRNYTHTRFDRALALSRFLSEPCCGTETKLEYTRRVLTENVEDDNSGQCAMDLATIYAEGNGATHASYTG